ncbi:MAG: Holliday junction resolvase RuvX [Verrucomicrobia bacterium]|nr:Holliday junction resolvase RuvX [Verrucomicrobiota bacterium]
MARILGVDYGRKRLGFAVSDHDEIVAIPHSVVTLRNTSDAVDATLTLYRETGAEAVVVGLPLSMDGSNSDMTAEVLAYVGKLQWSLDVPVETWDERLTSWEAEQILINAGTRRDKRKGLIDKLAAQIMLQSYLDSDRD